MELTNVSELNERNYLTTLSPFAYLKKALAMPLLILYQELTVGFG